MSIDDSELRALSASLGKVDGRLIPEARAVVVRAAVNIKTDARSRVSDHPTWKRLAQTITYGMAGNAHYSQAEVGYEDRGQGELAGIAEFGSARHDPHPALIPSVKAEEPNFLAAMEAAVAKATKL